MSKKLDTQALLKAMLNAAKADAAQEALIEQYKALGEQVKDVREGAYAKAMRIACQAESHVAFSQAYDGLKKAIRADGATVNSSVRSAFSAVKSSWDALAGVKGTTVAGTIRGKQVHYDIPESANDIPEALKSFSAMRQAADLARKARPEGGLDAGLTQKLEALRQHMLKAEGTTSHAALDAALAYFLVGEPPKKGAKAAEKVVKRTVRKVKKAAEESKKK